MAANRGYFDCDAFYGALDEIRKRKGLTWKKLADQTKVSASSLTRMGQGKHPDADSLTMLAAWSGLNPADFVTDEELKAKDAESLPKVMALLRADRTLSPEGIDAIQDLLNAAYRTFGRKTTEPTDASTTAARI